MGRIPDGGGPAIAWVKLDDKRAINAKLLEAGFAARGLDEAAICWCAMNETDGFLSDKALRHLASMHGCPKPQPLVERLIEVGRWRRSDARHGYTLNDFLKFNPSKAELESRRKTDRDRKRRAAGIHEDSERKPDGGAVESARKVPGYSPTVPTDRPDPDLTSGTTNGSARGPLPLVGRRVDEALA